MTFVTTAPYIRSRHTPLGHLERIFRGFLSSPRRPIHAAGFGACLRQTHEYMASFRSPLMRDKTYYEAKDDFLSRVRTAIANRDFSPLIWYRLGNHSLHLPSAFYKDGAGKFLSDTFETEFIGQLMRYIIHDVNHSSPRAILHYAVQDLAKASSGNLLKFLSETPAIPEIGEVALREFCAQLEAYCQYFEQIQSLGLAFWGDDQTLAHLPEINNKNLASFIRLFASAMALRFIGANFRIRDSEEVCAFDQNTLSIKVSPDLQAIRLPMILLATKLFCDIKNTLRIVWQREHKLFEHDRNDPYRGLSLTRALRGEPIPQPVHFKIDARPLTTRVWELRFSDNGEGIIVNHLLNPLVSACRNNPRAVPDKLRKAVVAWENGSPFAFNQLSIEYLLESIFLLGISTGTSEETNVITTEKGMGLWGSAALLARIGAQIKIGITPGGGFYESIVLPNSLAISSEEVAQVAQATWRHSYQA